MTVRSFIAFVLTSLAVVAMGADDAPPRAARSVHLSYVAPKCVSFYAEVTVEKVVPGSYFEVCGFNGGYFGIQEYANGKHVGIFSVWDQATGNDPNAVDSKNRVETLYVGDGVHASRFGGEGTGGHSDFNFAWKPGSTYKFFLTSRIVDQKTQYAAYLFDPEKNDWFHVATFSTPDGGKRLAGLYSFIEDFRRDTKSATEVRRAKFSNQWIAHEDGKWVPVTKARFTASGAAWEAKDTINAGFEGTSFFLQTGGDTVQTAKLNEVIEGTAPATPPSVPEVTWATRP
jgi:hypothetical protein